MGQADHALVAPTVNALTPIGLDQRVNCTIHLHGALKTQFGEELVVPGSTVSVAIRNMLIKKPAMRFVLEEGEYRVVRGNPDGGLDLDESMLGINIGPSRQIHLFPVARGGGGGHGGTFKTILGAVIVVAAIATAFVVGPEGFGLLSASEAFQVGATVALFGVSMLLGGLSRLLAPQPGLGASYLINGNLNTAQQGTPVPLVYGTQRVGSIVVASSYSAEDYNTSTSDYEGAGAYWNATGGYSGTLDAFDTGNPLPAGANGNSLFPGATGKGGGGKGGASSGGIEAPNTLESKAIVRLIDVLSEGPIGGLINGPQSIYFNNTPLMNADGTWNFRGVRWYAMYGTPEQQPVPGYPSATETVNVGDQVFYGTPVVQQIESTTAGSARVTVELPALYATNTQNGDINPSQLILEIEVATVVGTTVGTYSQVVLDTINGKCTSPYQRSYVFALPGAGVGTDPIVAWNIRVTKLTQESAVSTTINQLFWATYDEIVDYQISYADTAYIALEIDSEAFGSNLPTRTYLIEGIQVEVPANYNAANRTYATTGTGTSGGGWDYVTFQPETTSNPTWCLYDFLRNARYGLGLNAQNLETCAVQLYEISQYCDGQVPDGNGATEPRYQLNGVFNQRTSAFNLMQAIASTFRGQVYWAGGQVAVTADMPQNPVKIYSPANVIGGNFVYEGTSLKTRRTMANVHFTDPSNQYLPGIEPTELPQQIAQRGIFAADILGFGVTSRGLAHRLGNWLLYTENFQTETVTFSVGWDSASVVPGNLIQIADPNVAGIRMGGRLRSSTTVSALALDMVFSPVAGQTYQATIVLEDGTLAENYVISGFSTGTTAQGASYTIADLATPLAKLPLPGAMFILQDANVAPTEWQVVGITETQRGIFEIAAVAYNPAKYALVEDVPTLSIPTFSTLPASLISPLSPPTAVTASWALVGQGTTTVLRTLISWTTPVDSRITQYQISIVNSEGVTVAVLAVTGSSCTYDNLPPDTYYFAVRSLGLNGSTSSWAYSTAITISGESPDAPAAVTGLTAIGGFRVVYLQWVAPVQRDLQDYNVWRSSTATAPHQPGTLAALIGTSGGTAFTDGDHQTLAPGTEWNYWIEGVTTTDVVGALSAMVTVEVSAIISGDFAASAIDTIGAFAAGIQPIGEWSGASLPTSVAAAGGATTIFWTVNDQLYTWNSTTDTYQTATTAAYLGAGVLNSGVTVPGSAVSGSLTGASLPAGSIAGSIIASQIASVNATTMIGQITTTQITPNSITTPLIATGAITSALLAVGSPNNQIWNSCATLTDTGWSYLISSGTLSSGPVASSAYVSNWLLPAIGSGYMAATATGINFAAYWTPNGGYGLPVTPGATYIGQAAIACQNISGLVTIDWYTASGTYLSTSTSSTVAAGASSGLILSDYTVAFVVAAAPATAAFARLGIHGASSTTNAPLLVWTEALFGQVGSSTVGPVIWTPGGATQIAGGQIITESVTTEQLAANAVGTAQLNVGFGSNVISNPSLQVSQVGWSSSYYGATGTSFGLASVSTLYVAAEGAGQLFTSTISGSQTFNAIWTPVIGSYGVACVPGTWLEGQAKIGVLRCCGRVAMQFFNSSGSVVSTVYGNRVVALAGQTLSDFAISDVIAQVPAGAATVEFVVQAYNDGGADIPLGGGTVGVNTYLMFCQSLLGLTVANATTAQNYTPGGITSIQGGSIAANTITANQIAAGTITTTLLAAGTLSANNITSGVLNSSVVIGSVASFGSVQITNANIADLTVQTINIANGAISATTSSTGSSPSITLSVNNADSNIIITGQAIFLTDTGTNSFYEFTVVIQRNGTTVYSQPFRFGGQNIAAYSSQACILFNDTPGAAGSYTYSFSFSVTNSGGTLYGESLSSASLQGFVAQK